jgi:hypothetical protein
MTPTHGQRHGPGDTNAARSRAHEHEGTLMERHPFLTALATVAPVLTVGILVGGGVAWLLVIAWHLVASPHAIDAISIR